MMYRDHFWIILLSTICTCIGVNTLDKDVFQVFIVSCMFCSLGYTLTSETIKRDIDLMNKKAKKTEYTYKDDKINFLVFRLFTIPFWAYIYSIPVLVTGSISTVYGLLMLVIVSALIKKT